MKKIVTLCFSAGIQKTIEFSKIQLDKVNRSKNYRFDIAGKAVNSARVLTQLAKIYEKNLSESEIKEKVTLICPLGEKNLYFWEELSQNNSSSNLGKLVDNKLSQKLVNVIHKRLERIPAGQRQMLQKYFGLSGYKILNIEAKYSKPKS